MKAAVYHGVRDVRIETVPDALEPAAGQLTIRVSRCGVCGTDGHEYAHGTSLVPLTARFAASGHIGPMVLGHEFTGTVVMTAGDVGELAVGDRVVAGAGQWCGTCRACLAGRTNLCESYYTYGLQADGGLSEYITVPSQMCFRVPDELDDANAVLAQPLAIAVHALNRGGARAGDDVVIMGAGGIGSLLIAAAVARGARAHVLDVDAGRLGNALDLGASTALLADADGIAAAKEIATGGPDLVVEASGAGAALSAALAISRRGGRIVLLGLPSRPIEVAVRPAVVAEIDLVSSSAHVCATDIPAALAALAGRPIEHLIVDRVVPLTEVVAGAFEPMAAGALHGKAVIAISEGAEAR